MVRTWMLATMLIGFSATGARGQVPVVPQPVPSCDAIPLVGVDPANLTRSFLAGNWPDLRDKFDAIRKRLQPACVSAGDHWIVFVWPGKNALDDPALFSVVYPGVAPFSAVLPGVSTADRDGPRLYEVFVSMTGATLHSAYVVTREDDPVYAQAAAALEKNLEKIVAGTGLLVGPPGRPPALTDRRRLTQDVVDPAPVVVAAVSSVGLPFSRGKIAVKRRGLVPRLHEDLIRDADRLSHDIFLRDARDSQAAKDLAGGHVGQLREGLAGALCSGAGSTEELCRSELARRMSVEYARRFGAASEADRPILAAVDKRFRDHVAALSSLKIDLDATLTNEPTTYVTLGTVVGYIGTLWKEEVRVKVSSSGTLVEDPVPRALTGVTVNWSPAGYQASDPETSRAERYRLFTGVAITPNIGWIVGGSAQVFSGFSVNAGLGLLALPTGEIDQKPDSSRPFRTDWAWAPFFGAGFTWK